MNDKPKDTEQEQKRIAKYDIEMVQERIKRIFEEELNIDASEIDLDKDIRKQVYIDSIQLAEIYAAIVAELDIELPMSLLAATTIREMIDIVTMELERYNSNVAD
jgi:acyl carrier protein